MQRGKSWELLYTSLRRHSLLFACSSSWNLVQALDWQLWLFCVLCKRICLNGGSHNSCCWGIRIASIRKGRSEHNSSLIILKVITVKIMLLWCAELADGPIRRGPRHSVGRLGVMEWMFPYLWRRCLVLSQTMPQFQVRPHLSYYSP